jgi:peptidoglycan/LPS O-acetylase OafA/YrhL
MGLPSKGKENLLRPVMPELDTLRGMAVLLVVIFHGFSFAATVSKFSGIARIFVAATAGGWTGVNLFFVLSGFLITGILFDSKSRPDYYSRFYIRRALRILPAFYLLLLLLLVLPRTGLFEQRHVGWPFVVLSFFYLANMTGFFGVPGQYGALWSLAVEEHFYLLWPWIIRKLTRRAALWCAAGIVVACPTLRACAGYTWLVADGLPWALYSPYSCVSGRTSEREHDGLPPPVRALPSHCSRLERHSVS